MSTKFNPDYLCGKSECEENTRALVREYREEMDTLRRELEQAREDLKLNAGMLAKQCDLARQAETERDIARAEDARLRGALEKAGEWFADIEKPKLTPRVIMRIIIDALKSSAPEKPKGR